MPKMQITTNYRIEFESSCGTGNVTCSSASFSINAFRNRQLFDFTSRIRCSSSQTDESLRFFDIGRNVARIRLSTVPCGFRFISTN